MCGHSARSLSVTKVGVAGVDNVHVAAATAVAHVPFVAPAPTKCQFTSTSEGFPKHFTHLHSFMIKSPQTVCIPTAFRYFHLIISCQKIDSCKL